MRTRRGAGGAALTAALCLAAALPGAAAGSGLDPDVPVNVLSSPGALSASDRSALAQAGYVFDGGLVRLPGEPPLTGRRLPEVLAALRARRDAVAVRRAGGTPRPVSALSPDRLPDIRRRVETLWDKGTGEGEPGSVAAEGGLAAAASFPGAWKDADDGGPSPGEGAAAGTGASQAAFDPSRPGLARSASEPRERAASGGGSRARETDPSGVARAAVKNHGRGTGAMVDALAGDGSGRPETGARAPASPPAAIVLRVDQAVFQSQALLEEERKKLGGRVRDLSMGFQADGLHVSGRYHVLIVDLKFAAVLDLSSAGPDAFDIEVRKVDVAFVDVKALTGIILDAAKDRVDRALKGACSFRYAGKADGAQVVRVTLDMAKLLPAFPALSLTGVEIESGALVLRAGMR